jgi:hypothetical protein
MLEPVFSWILALGCALLLARAAAHKLAQRRELVAIVANYRIVPASWAAVAAKYPFIPTSWAAGAAVIVVISEIAAAVLLVYPPTRALGASIAASLFITYAAAIAVNLKRGRTHIDCGCVGPSQRRSIGAWMVWRNGVLAIAAAASATPVAARALSMFDLLTICGGVAALALVYSAFDQLGAIVTRTRTAS